MFTFKGTVSVISSDAPCKDGIAWFTTVPWVRNMQVTFAEKAQMKINSLLKKHWYLIHAWSKLSRLPLKIGLCYLWMKGQLKFAYSPFICQKINVKVRELSLKYSNFNSF